MSITEFFEGHVSLLMGIGVGGSGLSQRRSSHVEIIISFSFVHRISEIKNKLKSCGINCHCEYAVVVV